MATTKRQATEYVGLNGQRQVAGHGTESTGMEHNHSGLTSVVRHTHPGGFPAQRNSAMTRQRTRRRKLAAKPAGKVQRPAVARREDEALLRAELVKAKRILYGDRFGGNKSKMANESKPNTTAKSDWDDPKKAREMIHAR